MPIFKFSAVITVSAYTEVEADTLAEARAEAEARDMGIGGIGSGNNEDDMWVVTELDGELAEIRYVKG